MRLSDKIFWEEMKLSELRKTLSSIAEFHLWMDLGYEISIEKISSVRNLLNFYFNILSAVKKIWSRYPRRNYNETMEERLCAAERYGRDLEEVVRINNEHIEHYKGIISGLMKKIHNLAIEKRKLEKQIQELKR